LRKRGKDLVSSNISCSPDLMVCSASCSVDTLNFSEEFLEAEGECWMEPNLQLCTRHKISFPRISRLQLSQMQLWGHSKGYGFHS
ncbi:hypothetical protein BAE44_0011995, partial [Dichanthelium oligosanthes]